MIRKTISMPDAMGEWISDRVKSGQYNNESEYIRDLVRQDQDEQAKMAFLMNALAEGEADVAAGRVTTLRTEEDINDFFDDIIQEVKQNHAEN